MKRQRVQSIRDHRTKGKKEEKTTTYPDKDAETNPVPTLDDQAQLCSLEIQ